MVLLRRDFFKGARRARALVEGGRFLKERKREEGILIGLHLRRNSEEDCVYIPVGL